MKTIAIIGAGTMGRGISFETAKAGMTTMLQDVSDSSLQEAADYTDYYAGKSVDKEILSESEAQTLRSRIHYTNFLSEAVKHADIVIEAVLERMDLKISIFQQIDKYAPAEAVIASNTSTMSPTEMAAQTGRPKQCLAMHFFNPVPKMKLIEVIRGLETSDETVQKAKLLAKALHKTPVEVNEFPGFAVSRMNCLIGNEAMTMVMEG
nr:3-hydroxyacyl-CoA dehydrogenase NAD-binding domain-containing protein [Sinobaca sp. H24]